MIEPPNQSETKKKTPYDRPWPFVADDHGRYIYTPYGAFGAQYLLEDPSQYERLKKIAQNAPPLQMWYCMMGMHWFNPIGDCAMLLILVVWSVVFCEIMVRQSCLRCIAARPTFWAGLRLQANRVRLLDLWLMQIFCILCSTLLLLSRRDAPWGHWGLAIVYLTIGAYSVVSALIAVMIALRRPPVPLPAAINQAADR